MFKVAANAAVHNKRACEPRTVYRYRTNLTAPGKPGATVCSLESVPRYASTSHCFSFILRRRESGMYETHRY